MEYIATIKRTQQILTDYQLKAKKKYGQNFIIEPTMIEKIIHYAGIQEDTPVIEIGPGIGAMTQVMAQRTRLLTCFEIDEDMVTILKKELEVQPMQLVHQDFLKCDFQPLPHTKVVANLPYYITTKLIEKLALHHQNIDEMYLMVQKEVAVKLSTSTDLKDRLPLRLLLESLGTVDYLFDVPASIFMPKPHVDSAILKITFHHQEDFDPKPYYQFLKQAFTSRRKKLKNNIQVNESHLHDLGYPIDVRAEQMATMDLLKLYKMEEH